MHPSSHRPGPNHADAHVNDPGFESIDPCEAQRPLDDESPKIVEVRSVAELGEGRVLGPSNRPVACRRPRALVPRPDLSQVVSRTLGPGRKLPFLRESGLRFRQACLRVARAGCRDLSNIDAGFHGAPGCGGQAMQPGWATGGRDRATDAPPERTWPGLGPRAHG